MSSSADDTSFSRDLDDWLRAAAGPDRYVVERTLKQSDMETTELVWRRSPNGGTASGPFVRKTLVGAGSLGSAYQALFEAQVRGHRFAHVPLLYECEREGDVFVVVMECVHGETLEDLMARTGQGIGCLRTIMADLCDAVSELHESLGSPIIHRDIKPSNVMVSHDRIMLIDLGIARIYSQDATRDTMRLGTLGYAPPEQFGYGQTSTRSDVYALGMTCAYCLMGSHPTVRLAEEGFEDHRIPQPLRAVLAKATAFDPSQRHASARELKEDLVQAFASLDPPDAESTGETGSSSPQTLGIMGRIWNTLVCVAWVIIVLGCIAGTIHPSDNLTKFPPWFVALEYFGIALVPCTLVAYLLLIRRTIRSRIPFIANLSWKIEIPLCIGISILSMILVAIIGKIAFGGLS